jgi:hypothetical protein
MISGLLAKPRQRLKTLSKNRCLPTVPTEDLGPSDLVKIDCTACSHTALLTPAFLTRLGLKPRHRVLDLKDRVRCRGCGVRGRAVVSIKWERIQRR